MPGLIFAGIIANVFFFIILGINMYKIMSYLFISGTEVPLLSLTLITTLIVFKFCKILEMNINGNEN